jgi:hypothetical protein
LHRHFPPFAEIRAIHRCLAAVRRNPVSPAVLPRYRYVIHSTEAAMERDNEQSWRKQLVWGIILTGIGVAFLLDRGGALDLSDIGRYWPWLFVIAGLSNLAPPTTTKLVLDGVSCIFFGVWCYVSIEHVWGLNFFNSWPLLVIWWGVKLMLKPILHNYFDVNKEQDYGK